MRPILPYNEQLAPKPNPNSANNSNNTGSAADSREATSSVIPSQPLTYSQPMSTAKYTSDKGDQTVRNVQGSGKSTPVRNSNVQNVLANSHQNKGIRPEAGPFNSDQTVCMSDQSFTKDCLSQYATC